MTNKKINKKELGYRWLTRRRGSVRGKVLNTGCNVSGPLPPRDKHHTPPSCWQALHLSTACTLVFLCFYGNIIIFCIKKCHILTWVLLAGAFVGAAALVRVVDGSVKKKEETSVMSLLEVELLCRASAGRNCKTQNWFMTVLDAEKQTFTTFILQVQKATGIVTFISNITGTTFQTANCCSKPPDQHGVKSSKCTHAHTHERTQAHTRAS